MSLLGILEALKINEGLSLTEQLIASGFVTVFSISIVFIVLLILRFFMWVMMNITEARAEKRAGKTNKKVQEISRNSAIKTMEEKDELVAVITAAINELSGSDKIVVKKISRLHDIKPTWFNSSNYNHSVIINNRRTKN